MTFTLAIPFFKNSLMGNVFFTSVLFGGFEIVKIARFSLVTKLRENKLKV